MYLHIYTHKCIYTQASHFSATNQRQTLNPLPNLRQTNIAMENGPFEDEFPLEHGDIPLLY